METMTTDGILARIPGHGSFAVTGAAVTMIEVFGGLLHCYQGQGGCRRQGLYFSRTEPKKPLRCLLANPGSAGTGFRETETRDGWNPRSGEDIIVSVSHELAPKLDGVVLDFGNYNKMQRFVWLAMPAVKGPACTCLRSAGPRQGNTRPAWMTKASA